MLDSVLRVLSFGSQSTLLGQPVEIPRNRTVFLLWLVKHCELSELLRFRRSYPGQHEMSKMSHLLYPIPEQEIPLRI